MIEDLHVWWNAEHLRPLQLKQTTMKKARRTLCKVGVRLPDEVPVFRTDLGRDPVYTWTDRYNGHERVSAVVRSPKRWRRVSVVFSEDSDMFKYTRPHEVITAFRDSILAVAQGGQPMMHYMDAEARIDTVLDWIEHPGQVPVPFIDYSLLVRGHHPNNSYPHAKLRRNAHTLLVLYKNNKYTATFVPYLAYESGLFVHEIARVEEWEPVGGLTAEGKKFVALDGLYQDYIGGA